jgi:hypothetical protein
MEEKNQILKEQIEKLPKALKKFVLDNEWTRKLENYLGNFNLEEWQKTSVENEVFLVLLGFEEYGSLPGNISENTEIDLEIAEKIAEFIIKDILNPIANIVIKEYKEPEIASSNNIGQSFEKIILNQAKAMQPAREEGWVPENLPAEKSEEKPQVSTPNYTGQDPYRETLE